MRRYGVLRYILPIIYGAAAAYLVLGPPGGAGGGWGIAWAWHLGLPATLLMPDSSGFWGLWVCGIVQYFVLGFVLDRLIIARLGKGSEGGHE